ncbi:MAG: rod shape-determining protein [Lachnospiraceae bacterium]|nr:rod shape-determining protein [Lachnospiraceae bacterium]
MLGSNNFGIDLGTSQVKIFAQKDSSITVEKNMVAIRKKRQLLAIGNEAFQMYEKTPPSIDVSSTVREGALYDIDRAEALLHLLLQKIDNHIGIGPSLFFSAPSSRSELEEHAYYIMACAGYLKNPKVFLVDRPICDAIALGIPLSRTDGSMVVNIGAQNTDVSVIAREQVIISKSIPIGGQQMNAAICDNIRRQTNLLVGRRTARRLKAVLSSFEDKPLEARKVIGLNILSGLPRDGVIPASLVNEAVTEQMTYLAAEIREFIERTPPQISRSILNEGIYLTGGTTRIPGIDTFFSEKCRCKVNVSSYYDMCTVKGLEELMTHKALHKWAKAIKG